MIAASSLSRTRPLVSTFATNTRKPANCRLAASRISVCRSAIERASQESIPTRATLQNGNLVAYPIYPERCIAPPSIYRYAH